MLDASVDMKSVAISVVSLLLHLKVADQSAFHAIMGADVLSDVENKSKDPSHVGEPSFSDGYFGDDRNDRSLDMFAGLVLQDTRCYRPVGLQLLVRPPGPWYRRDTGGHDRFSRLATETDRFGPVPRTPERFYDSKRSFDVISWIPRAVESNYGPGQMRSGYPRSSEVRTGRPESRRIFDPFSSTGGQHVVFIDDTS